MSSQHVYLLRYGTTNAVRWVQDGGATHLGDYSGNLVSVYDMFKGLIYVDATVILCKKNILCKTATIM